MGQGWDDPAAAFAREGGTIAEFAGLRREELIVADDGRPLLLLPAGEPSDARDSRIRAALATLAAPRT